MATTDNEIGLAINAIADLTGHAVTFSGGGKGQVAQVQMPDGSYSAVKGTSRLAAVTDLLAAVKAELKPVKAKPVATEQVRVTLEGAIAALQGVFGEFDIEEEDEEEDRTPGPVWKGTTLVRIVPCVGECMGAFPTSPCDCRCGGSNHAIGGVAIIPLLTAALTLEGAARKQAFIEALAAARPVQFGPKECKCGCGGITQRTFVPGHDARYHAAIKRAQAEAAA